MTSLKKIAANRVNSKKSSGPRSLFGKAKSCRNALRHGFAAFDPKGVEHFHEIEKIASALCPGDKDTVEMDLARVIAENEVLLRCIRQDRVSTLARMADPEAVPALHRGIGEEVVKARHLEFGLAWDELARVEQIMMKASDEEFDRPFTPNWFPTIPKERDELEAMEAAQRDLKRFKRYERRAWSRRRRAVRNLIAWRVLRVSKR